MAGKELSDFIDQQVSELSSLCKDLGMRWVERKDFSVLIRFFLGNGPKEFVMRCTYRENANHPLPSIGFVNSETLVDEGGSNWPRDSRGALKVTSNPPFICLPGVYEYHYQYHLGAPVLRHHLSLVNTVTDIIGLLNR